MRETVSVKIYTIVRTYANSDAGIYPDPAATDSYLSIEKAREELARLTAEEKEILDSRFDTVEEGEDYWEAYEDGYAAGHFSRIEIVTTELRDLSEGPPCGESAAILSQVREWLIRPVGEK